MENEKYIQHLYHLTSANKLPSILENGLIPCIGSSSAKVMEKELYVYLCDYQSLPYWEILLGKSLVLRIEDLKFSDCKRYEYSAYREFVYEKHIRPEKLSVVEAPLIQVKHMRKLCLSYLETISFITVSVAKYYNDHLGDDTYKEITECDLNMLLAVADKLDYSVLSANEIQNHLVEFAESGEYSFTDTYLNTGRRLWEQLLYYGDDSLKDKRTDLYNYIKKKFEPVLYINTGGWTG